MEPDKDLMEYLKGIVKFRDQYAGELPEDWKYNSIEDFVLQHGQAFEFHPLPERMERGPMKECFRNAFNMMLQERNDLIYVEGFAYGCVIPVHHAWCVDKDGRVFDFTWEEGWGYYGIPFKREFVMETILRTERFGVIDNFSEGFPLLRGLCSDYREPV